MILYVTHSFHLIFLVKSISESKFLMTVDFPTYSIHFNKRLLEKTIALNFELICNKMLECRSRC